MLHTVLGWKEGCPNDSYVSIWVGFLSRVDLLVCGEDYSSLSDSLSLSWFSFRCQPHVSLHSILLHARRASAQASQISTVLSSSLTSGPVLGPHFTTPALLLASSLFHLLPVFLFFFSVLSCPFSLLPVSLPHLPSIS